MANTSTRRQTTGKTQQPSPRRWLAVVVSVTVLAAATALGVAAYRDLSQPGRLPLRVIQVSGDFRELRPEEIQQTVVEAIDGGFFSCDMQKLRNRVLEMPWVADVSIRRVWPDKLNMVVTEEVPLARWGEDALINIGGGVFRPPSLDGLLGLVKLDGPAGSEQRVVEFLQTAVPAARARDLQVREIRLDQRRHWWVLFDDGLTLSLGRENVGYRLSQFFRVYPSLIAQPARRPERIDMRYAHGFAVRWREPAAQGTAAHEVKMQEKV